MWDSTRRGGDAKIYLYLEIGDAYWDEDHKKKRKREGGIDIT